MKVLMLLLVFTGFENGLETSVSITVKGYATMKQCEFQLAAMKRQLPADVVIEYDDCVEGML